MTGPTGADGSSTARDNSSGLSVRFYLDEPDVTAEPVLAAAAAPSTAGWDLARRVRLAADRRRLAAMAVQRGWAVMHLARAAKVHGLSNAMNFSRISKFTRP